MSSTSQGTKRRLASRAPGVRPRHSHEEPAIEAYELTLVSAATAYAGAVDAARSYSVSRKSFSEPLSRFELETC